jgi:hypothetical protein
MHRLLSEIVVVRILSLLAVFCGCAAGRQVTLPCKDMSPRVNDSALTKPRRTPANGNGLTLKLEQLPSANELVVKFTLTNTTKEQSFFVHSRPDFEHHVGSDRMADVSILVVDMHNREVRSQCTAMPRGFSPSDFGPLSPGRSLEFAYTFNPNCYSLVPGEALSMLASYMSAVDWPDAQPGTVAIDEPVYTALRNKIIVPSGWKDTVTR